MSGQEGIDDRDVRAVFIVCPGKVAARDEGDCESFEEAGRDGCERRSGNVSGAWSGLEGNGLARAAFVSCWNRDAGDSSGAHGGKTCNGFGELPAVAAHLNVFETLWVGGEMKFGDADLLESRIEGPETLQGSPITLKL